MLTKSVEESQLLGFVDSSQAVFLSYTCQLSFQFAAANTLFNIP
jgi:hypothetical protein